MQMIWQAFKKQHASDVVNRTKHDDVFTCTHEVVASLVVFSNKDFTFPWGIDTFTMVLSNKLDGREMMAASASVSALMICQMKD
jgi:hypothetical protein